MKFRDWLRMSKLGTKFEVPELRFPEFINYPKWENKPFSKLFEIGSGKDHKHLADGDIPVYGSGGYMRSVNDYLYEGKSACIGRKGTINKPMFLSGKFWTVDTLFYTHSFKNCIPEFIYLLFQNIDWLKLNEAGGVPSLSKVIINKIEVVIPKEEEQQKIVDCIYSVDDLITVNTKKLESLKLHKKGLMQKLFPAEGENKPDFRFPEFSMEANWKKEKLHNLVDLLSGHAFKSEYFSTTGKKMVTPKNFTKNGFASFSEDNTKYTSEDFNERYICREGDLLLLLTDLTPSCELLGRPMLLTPSDGEVLLNQRIAKVILKGNINSNFLKYFFLSNSFRKRIINTATGSTVRHTSNKIVLSTELLLPNLSEQNKIAACLLSIDELIRSQADKIETLKEYKKGLMQQLFPEMKESIA